MTENMAARGEGLAGLVAGDKVLVMVEFLGQRGQEAKIAIKSLGSVTNWDGEAQISVPVAALESPRKLTCAADAEAMLRKRWIGDLDRIPLGKVVEFMQSFAEQYLNLFPPEIQTVLDKRTGEIAALEAAAPASTARDLNDEIVLLDDELALADYHAAGFEQRAELIKKAFQRVRALATPSPQAPHEQTHFCQNTKQIELTPISACSCATQEQPAGNAPIKSVEWFKERMREQVAFDDAQVSQLLGMKPANRSLAEKAADDEYSRVCPLCGEGYNLPTCDLCHVETVVAAPPERRAKRFVGSPRKVGEDGADDKNYYASYANHCAIQRQIPLTFPAWKRQGKVNAPNTEVSSVPVGEQKQEQGV